MAFPDHLHDGRPEPARPGLLRRTRRRLDLRFSSGGWSCPDCGLPTKDPLATRLGFCVRCRQFTGMCAAGRTIVCGDVMTVTSWHTPCTSRGASAWRFSDGAEWRVTLLCPQHDAEVRTRGLPWLGKDAALAPADPAR